MGGLRGVGLIAVIVMLSASAALAKAALVPLPEKVKRCDLIARVRIVSTKSFGDKEVEGYRSEARIRLLEVLKGPNRDREVDLAFDNGFACPNVHYKAGEECLVFLTRE